MQFLQTSKGFKCGLTHGPDSSIEIIIINIFTCRKKILDFAVCFLINKWVNHLPRIFIVLKADLDHSRLEIFLCSLLEHLRHCYSLLNVNSVGHFQNIFITVLNTIKIFVNTILNTLRTNQLKPKKFLNEYSTISKHHFYEVILWILSANKEIVFKTFLMKMNVIKQGINFWRQTALWRLLQTSSSVRSFIS